MFKFLTLKTEAERASVSPVRSANVHNNYILHDSLTTLHIFHTACQQDCPKKSVTQKVPQLYIET